MLGGVSPSRLWKLYLVICKLLVDFFLKFNLSIKNLFIGCGWLLQHTVQF